MSYIEPSVDRTDFSCPYCRAHTSQTWWELYAHPIKGDKSRPFVPRSAELDIEGSKGMSEEIKDRAKRWATRMVSREVFIEEASPNDESVLPVNNLFMSSCFNCQQLAVWLNRSLIVPSPRTGESPNPDLRPDIRADIDEARAILEVSPRGAVALLRLAVQKLCQQLGEPGKNIDTDIQSLVDKGMNPHLQQAFDVVRVIGNEAVHPGTIDLSDDHETAVQLISLINIVAQQMISNQNAIKALYAKLPPGKLKGIESRANAASRKQGRE
jgi:hypothetical protein